MDATHATRIDPSNAEQLRAWDGDEGAYWAANADRYDRAVAEHHARLMQAAGIAADERVLDIGCGTGQTTRDAARAASRGFALGVDLSTAMLAHARASAEREGIANVSFEHADAQVHPFEAAGFDVVVSRTGAMFFGDPIAAFTNLARAMRPGARLVLLSWQSIEQNEWLREFSGALAAGRDMPGPPPNAPGPFALSQPDHVRGVLTSAGFSNVDLDGFTAGMWFGADADDASQFVLGQLGWMLNGLDADGQERARTALRASAAAHETSRGVIYDSGAWIIQATKP